MCRLIIAVVLVTCVVCAHARVTDRLRVLGGGGGGSGGGQCPKEKLDKYNKLQATLKGQKITEFCVTKNWADAGKHMKLFVKIDGVLYAMDGTRLPKTTNVCMRIVVFDPSFTGGVKKPHIPDCKPVTTDLTIDGVFCLGEHWMGKDNYPCEMWPWSVNVALGGPFPKEKIMYDSLDRLGKHWGMAKSTVESSYSAATFKFYAALYGKSGEDAGAMMNELVKKCKK